MKINQGTRRFAARAAAPLAVLLLTSGCGGGGKSSPAGLTVPPSQGVLQPNVVPIPDDGSVSVTNVTPSSLTLTGNVPPLKAGMIIAGGLAPGVMRKVVSVVQSDGSEMLQTTDAALTDVFQQASIHFSGPVTFEPISSSSFASSAGSRFAPSATASSPLNFPNVKIPSLSGAAGVTLDTKGSITMTLTSDIEISNGHLNSVNISASLGGQLNVTASAQADATLSTVPVRLIQLGGSSITIARIEGIPVNVTPELDVNATADGEVSAGVSVGASGSMTAAAGVQYDGANWSPIDTYTQQFSITPTLSGSADAVCDITPISVHIQALFDGVLGPEIDVDCPKFTIGVHSSPPPLTVAGDVDGDVGVVVGAFGINKSYASPRFHNTFLLFPTGTLQAGAYSDQPPLLNGDYPWTATVDSFPDGNGGTLLQWIYATNSNSVPNAFSVSYSCDVPGSVYLGQVYTLSIFGFDPVPPQYPQQIAIQIDQGSGSIVSVAVSGAPSWMRPPAGEDFYTYISGTNPSPDAKSLASGATLPSVRANAASRRNNGLVPSL